MFITSFHDSVNGDTIFTNQIIDQFSFSKKICLPFKKISLITIFFSFILFLPTTWIRTFSINNFKKIILLKFEITNNNKVILINHHRNCWVAVLCILFNIPFSIIYQNIESQIYYKYFKYSSNVFKKMLFFREYFIVKFWESFLSKKAQSIYCITSDDANFFLKFNNNIILKRPSLSESHIELSKNFLTYNIKPILIIIGSFDWRAKKINLLNFIKSKGKLRIFIFGKNSLESNSTFKSQSIFIMGAFDSPKSIPALLGGNVGYGIVIDVIGGGFKMKILDYLSLGMPVLALIDCIDFESSKVIPCFSTRINMENFILNTTPTEARKLWSDQFHFFKSS